MLGAVSRWGTHAQPCFRICLAFNRTGWLNDRVSMSDTDLHKKIYRAQGGHHSIIDLLRSFTNPDLEVDGISAVSDLHMKVGEPVRYRLDGELETIQDGEPLTEAVIKALVYPMITEAQGATGGESAAGSGRRFLPCRRAGEFPAKCVSRSGRPRLRDADVAPPYS